MLPTLYDSLVFMLPAACYFGLIGCGWVGWVEWEDDLFGEGLREPSGFAYTCGLQLCRFKVTCKYLGQQVRLSSLPP